MRANTPLEKRVLEIVEPLAHDLDFEIVRVRLQGSARRQRLQIMAERADGSMSAQDCGDLSRALSARLDVEDPFRGEWELEVSSPGIDRPLTMPSHFDRWEGFSAKLHLDRLVEGRKRFTGLLAGYDADNQGVMIDLDGEEETAVIPFDWIDDAKLVLTDELIEESLRRRPQLADLSEIELEEDTADDADQEEEQ
jgi:ribosome maturation factor RimP